MLGPEKCTKDNTRSMVELFEAENIYLIWLNNPPKYAMLTHVVAHVKET